MRKHTLHIQNVSQMQQEQKSSTSVQTWSFTVQWRRKTLYIFENLVTYSTNQNMQEVKNERFLIMTRQIIIYYYYLLLAYSPVNRSG